MIGRENAEVIAIASFPTAFSSARLRNPNSMPTEESGTMNQQRKKPLRSLDGRTPIAAPSS